VGHPIHAAPVEDVALKLRIGSLDLACHNNFSPVVQIVGEKVKCLVWPYYTAGESQKTPGM
jgi:hypothetical protein